MCFERKKGLSLFQSLFTATSIIKCSDVGNLFTWVCLFHKNLNKKEIQPSYYNERSLSTPRHTSATLPGDSCVPVSEWVGPERGLFPVSMLGLKPQFSSELREEAWSPVVRNEAPWPDPFNKLGWHRTKHVRWGGIPLQQICSPAPSGGVFAGRKITHTSFQYSPLRKFGYGV